MADARSLLLEVAGQQPERRAPLDIVLVLDVSGSMEAAAEIPGTEAVGLSTLDTAPGPTGTCRRPH